MVRRDRILMSGTYQSDELAKLHKIDQQLVEALVQRITLTQEILGPRTGNPLDPVYMASVEPGAVGVKEGLDAEFVRRLWQLMVDEATKAQPMQIRHPEYRTVIGADEEVAYQSLKDSLLALTARVAPSYDEQYARAFFATRSYLAYENRILGQELWELQDHRLALDLGCATGREAFQLSRYFERVIGFDISPDMIATANENLKQTSLTNVSFKTADLEKGIPQPDGSASLVLLTLGTGSDLRNIRIVLSEAQRVLIPEGKILVSFYNKDALLYRLGVVPWAVGLAAEIDLEQRCLTVRCGREVYPVYARPYGVEEVRELFPTGIEVTQIITYPTLASVLPNGIFEEERVQRAVVEIDKKLADSGAGAYVIAVGRRVLDSDSPLRG